MAKLIIKRNPAFLAKYKRFNIYLNDKAIGKIGNGKTFEFDAPSGTYDLKIGFGRKWNISNNLSFTVNENESRHFEVGYNKAAGKQFFSFIFIMLIVIPGTMIYTLPYKPIDLMIVILLLMAVGVVGFIWTLKQQKDTKEKPGIHLVETTSASAKD